MANKQEISKEPLQWGSKNILMVRDLKKYFPIRGGMMNRVVGQVKAVDGVTFNLERGTTMGLVGESGCGKTTTGRTILRLAGDKTGGDVLFEGKEVCRWWEDVRLVRIAPLGGGRSPRFFTHEGYDHFVCIGEMLRVGESRSSLDPRGT